MQNLTRFFFFILLPIAGVADGGSEPASLRSALAMLDIRERPADLAEAPIDGFYEIVRGMQVLYLSHDGETIIDGDILSISHEVNHTEARRAEIRSGLVAAIPREERIVVRPLQPPRARITVFVDTDCPYCRALHGKLGVLGEHGIAIDYLFYPRSGPGSETFLHAETVWCSSAPLEALKRALAGDVSGSADCANPVQHHYEVGRAIDLRGTPAILMPDGDITYGVVDIMKLIAAVAPDPD